MSFYIHVKNNKTSCPNACDLFNDTSKFSYCESNETTQDELYVVDYLIKNKPSIKKDLNQMNSLKQKSNYFNHNH